VTGDGLLAIEEALRIIDYILKFDITDDDIKIIRKQAYLILKYATIEGTFCGYTKVNGRDGS
jgi:hypothetical protein